LCLLTKDNDNPIIIRPHIVLTEDDTKQRFYYSKLTWYNKENCWTNKSFTCLPLRTDDHILEWSSAFDTSVIDNWKINNPTLKLRLIEISERVHFFCLWYLDEPWNHSFCKETLIKEKINNIESINLTHDFVFNFFSLCIHSLKFRLYFINF
jgi:hypothetical protein